MLRHGLLLLPLLRHHDPRAQQQRPQSRGPERVRVSRERLLPPAGHAGELQPLTLPFSFLSFWFFKFLVLVGITVGAFFIPDGDFNAGNGAASLFWTPTPPSVGNG